MYSPTPEMYKPVSPDAQMSSPTARMQTNQTPPVFRHSPVPPNLPPPIMPTKVFQRNDSQQGNRSPPAPEPQRSQSPSRQQNIAKNVKKTVKNVRLLTG
jgi:hypothetical protein